MASKLFTPITLAGLELRNRIVVAPMCQYSAEEGCATDWHLMHLGQFSVSGVGLLIMEMTNVQANGRITPHCMGLYNDDNEHASGQGGGVHWALRQYAILYSTRPCRSQSVHCSALGRARWLNT